MLRLPELFRNSKKEHDPEREVAFHEVGHGLVQVSFGLLPKYTSMNGYKRTIAFNTAGFYIGWEVGVDWKKEGPKYALMLNFGGIVGGAFYSGIYDWDRSWSDIQKAERNIQEYGFPFSEVLGVWVDTHDSISKYADLLERAAEKLCSDEVLDDHFWEEEILLGRLL